MQDQLIEKYLTSLEQKAEKINGLWEDHLKGKSDALDGIRLEAHSLKGSGATFGFPEISDAGRALEEANDTDFRDKLISLLNLLGSMTAKKRPAPGTAPSQTPPVTQKSTTALIIERNGANARIIKDCIGKLDGINDCIVVESGAQAREQFKKSRFALIVLDIVLPDQDGRELLREIKSSKDYSCPVLVISGVPSDSIYLECMRLGADQYLSKPFDTDKLFFEARQLAAPSHLQVVSSNMQKVAEKAEARKTVQLEGEHFLVAEDDEMQGIFITQVLEEQGARVTLVENGQKALDALEDGSFSAVILDGKMQVMDGFSTLRKIRQTPRLKSLPVIMVTAMGSEENIIKGYQYGANDYILKPFSEEQLISRINSLLVMAA